MLETQDSSEDKEACSVEHKPRWSRRKDARPQDLLYAALDHFVQYGFAATRLEDVARQAGVSKGTLYLYYESKEELFKAVVRQTLVPLLGQSMNMVDAYQGSSVTLFQEIVKNWWHNVAQSKMTGVAKLMMAESNNFPELAQFYREEVTEPGDLIVQKIIKRGIDRGEFVDCDVRLTAKLVVSPIVLMMIWKSSMSVCGLAEDEFDAYLEQYMVTMIRGLSK